MYLYADAKIYNDLLYAYCFFAQIGREDSLLHEWLDCCLTDSGVLVAKMKVNKRPLLVRQMLDEWSDR